MNLTGKDRFLIAEARRIAEGLGPVSDGGAAITDLLDIIGRLTPDTAETNGGRHGMNLITDNDRLDAARADQLPVTAAGVKEYTGEADITLAFATAYAEARVLAGNLAAAVRRLDGDHG